MTISLPALFEAPPRASGWAMAACFGLSLLFLVGFVAPSPHADDWGSLATISTTMGVNEGRICTGESTRGDLGCPANAPYVSRTTGWLGIGTQTPQFALDVSGTLRVNPSLSGADSAYFITTDFTTGGVVIRSVSGSFMRLLPHTAASSYNPLAGTGDSRLIFSNGSPNNGNFMLGPWNSEPVGLRMLGSNGFVAINKITPTTSLDVSGTVKATAFVGDGSGLTNLATGGTSDRIVSGTTSLSVTENGTSRLYGSSPVLNMTPSASSSAVIQVGHGRTGDGYAYIDLIGDTTYNDYGLRFIRNNTGANATSSIQHRGTGGLFLQALEAAPIVFATSNTEAMRIAANGNIGIGYSTPAYPLDVVSSSQTMEATMARFISQAPVSGFSKTNIRLMKSTLYGAELSGYLNQGIDSGLVFSTIASGATTERIRISSNGNTGIGTTTPTTKLEVAGTVSATTLQLADNPANPCNAANKGMAKVIDGRIYVCRYP